MTSENSNKIVELAGGLSAHIEGHGNQTELVAADFRGLENQPKPTMLAGEAALSQLVLKNDSASSSEDKTAHFEPSQYMNDLNNGDYDTV